MEIIVHRGTHQIGGCTTEYKTANTRIFIDFGSELDAENAKPFDIDGVTKGITNCDAIFFTHYHGDHIGLIETINKDIPLYMGEAAKQISVILNDRISLNKNIKSYEKDTLNKIITFKASEPIIIGDITITAYCIDHSAYDAYMFLIEGDGKKVLHTGDFRQHGFRGKGLEKVLKTYIKSVDALVCEGTTLNRSSNTCETEAELKNRIKIELKNNKYVFVVCSSTNIDRIAGICSVVPKGKYCLCDRYQLSIIKYIREYASHKSSLYSFPKMMYYDTNLDEQLIENGFCMFVRCGNSDHKIILEKFKDKKPLIIYSMWTGYLSQDNVKNFLEGYTTKNMHTSGHADTKAIKMVIDTIKPNKIIPMHTEVPNAFLSIAGTDKVVLVNDGDKISL